MTFAYKDYLQSLGMGDTLINRLERVYEFYVSVLPEPVEDLFVCDYNNQDGTRVYESAWFFASSYACEARAWETSDNWDVLRFGRTHYWRVEKENFDFGKQPPQQARLYIEFAALPTNTGQLRAAGNNCAHLERIFLKYINGSMTSGPIDEAVPDSSAGRRLTDPRRRKTVTPKRRVKS